MPDYNASFACEGIVFLPVTPGGTIDIDGTTFDVKPFYIAKHETTNAQYDAFVQSGDGFDSPAWWVDMPAEYAPPQLDFDQRNNLPDAPHCRLSWYQAVAYTRWLNARMGAKNADISAGGLSVNGVEWEVRLPTEWEWQWAAQGGAEERDYPWGDWHEGHANTWEAGVGATTAVGSYPEGAAISGALDMSGNVWEWCLNKRNPPYDTAVDSTHEYRVLRGGSCHDARRLAASSFRDGSHPRPLFADVGRGFRVGLFPLCNSGL
jgi:formylglycine-generating enzyme required for sulfatase activity